MNLLANLAHFAENLRAHLRAQSTAPATLVGQINKYAISGAPDMRFLRALVDVYQRAIDFHTGSVMAVTSLPCTCCTRLRALIAASAPGRKAEHFLHNTCVARACCWVCFGLPGTRVHIDFCDTPRFLQLVFGQLMVGHCPLHRCRVLKVNFATGATGHCHQMQRH